MPLPRKSVITLTRIYFAVKLILPIASQLHHSLNATAS